MPKDLEALHGVVSIDRKIAIKRDTLIPKYAGYVARLREEGRPHELVGYFLVWLFDCGFIERALDLAGWCAEHGQGLPDCFKASLPAFVARQILDWSQQTFDEGASPEPFFSQVYARLFDPDRRWRGTSTTMWQPNSSGCTGSCSNGPETSPEPWQSWNRPLPGARKSKPRWTS
ncbi:MAG: phage terminase small subunit [Bilophila sp.]